MIIIDYSSAFNRNKIILIRIIIMMIKMIKMIRMMRLAVPVWLGGGRGDRERGCSIAII